MQCVQPNNQILENMDWMYCLCRKKHIFAQLKKHGFQKKPFYAMCANRRLYLCQLKHGSKTNFSFYVCNQTAKTRKEMCKLTMDPKANFCCNCVQPTHTDMDVCCLCKNKHIFVQLNMNPKPTFAVNMNPRDVLFETRSRMDMF